MKHVARLLLGAGGVLWGADSAVLVQQYGLWPLDAPPAYGASPAGAVVSGLWSRSNHFPVTSRHEFRDENGIDHTGYFANEYTGHKLEEWLRDQPQSA